MTGKCMVPNCPDRLRTPRLCNQHTIAWWNSAEETETHHPPFDQVGAFARWLARVSGAGKVQRE